jgi:Fe-S-cluster containining protein
MDSQQAGRHVAAEIEGVGTTMRSLAGRYEGIFTGLAATLQATLKRAVSMADAARDALDIAEAAASAFRDHIPNQPAVACASGCAPCCHLYVDVHFAPPVRAALIERLALAATAFRATPDPERLRLPCVLLGDDNRCSVYEVRPLSCRAFTSRSLPRCQQVVFGDVEGGVEQNAGHFRIFTEATFALEQAAKDRGLSAAQQGLVLALLDEMTLGK